jgi:hypothetical protein
MGSFPSFTLAGVYSWQGVLEIVVAEKCRNKSLLLHLQQYNTSTIQAHVKPNG